MLSRRSQLALALALMAAIAALFLLTPPGAANKHRWDALARPTATPPSEPMTITPAEPDAMRPAGI